VTPLLAIEKVTKTYGGVRAVDGVCLQLAEKGGIRGLIGPNGAGKSTLLNLICGLERPTAGEIYFKGEGITLMPPHQISALGIGRTFQATQLVEHLTVAENVMVGRHLHTRVAFLTSGFWLPQIWREENRNRIEAHQILDFLGLLFKAGRSIQHLSDGEKRLVELGRALALEPALLLLDEPAGGLTPGEVKVLGEMIHRLRDRGVTVLIVEHHMGLVMEISHWITVLHHGKVIAEGPPEEIKRDQAVISAYLGRGGSLA